MLNRNIWTGIYEVKYGVEFEWKFWLVNFSGGNFFGEIFWRNGFQKWIQKGVFDLYTNFYQNRSIFEKVLKIHYGVFMGHLHP